MKSIVKRIITILTIIIMCNQYYINAATVTRDNQYAYKDGTNGIVAYSLLKKLKVTLANGSVLVDMSTDSSSNTGVSVGEIEDKLKIVFVIDNSSSMGPRNGLRYGYAYENCRLAKVKKYMKNLIQELNNKCNDLEIGYVCFSSGILNDPPPTPLKVIKKTEQ